MYRINLARASRHVPVARYEDTGKCAPVVGEGEKCSDLVVNMLSNKSIFFLPEPQQLSITYKPYYGTLIRKSMGPDPRVT